MIAKKIIVILARIREKWIREHLNKLNSLKAPWCDESCSGIVKAQAQPISDINSYPGETKENG